MKQFPQFISIVLVVILGTAYTAVTFSNSTGEVFTCKVYDATGRYVQQINNIVGNSFSIERKQLTPGLYHFVLQSATLNGQGNFVVEK